MQKRIRKKFDIKYKKKKAESVSFKKQKEAQKGQTFHFVVKRKDINS